MNDSKKTNERWFWYVLTIGLVVFAGLALAIGRQQSIWFDEAYTITLAQHPVSEAIALTSVDTHPPLFYILLRGWGTLFQWNELALRALSVISMTAAVGLLAIFVKKAVGARAGMMTAMLLSIAPFMLRYAFEIRMYAFATLLCTAGTVLVYLLTSTRQHDKTRRYSVLYAIVVALGMYTLYYTAFVWLAHLLWSVYHYRRNFFKSPVMVSYVGAVALFLPWLPSFVKQFTNGALAPISEPMTVTNVLSALSFNIFSIPLWKQSQVENIFFLMFIILFGWSIYQVCRARDGRQKRAMTYLSGMLCAPVGLFMILSIVRPMYVERYLIHVMIVWYAVVGITLTHLLRSQRRLVSYGMIALIAAMQIIGIVNLTSFGNFNFQRMDVSNAKHLVANLHCDASKAIVTTDPYVAIETQYYANTSGCKTYFVDKPTVYRGGYAPVNTFHSKKESFADVPEKTIVTIRYNSSPEIAVPAMYRQQASDTSGALQAVTFSAE